MKSHDLFHSLVDGLSEQNIVSMPCGMTVISGVMLFLFVSILTAMSGYSVLVIVDLICGTKRAVKAKVASCKETYMPLSQGQSYWDCYVTFPFENSKVAGATDDAWLQSYESLDKGSEVTIVYRKGRFTGWKYGVQLGQDEEPPVSASIQSVEVASAVVEEIKKPARARPSGSRKTPERAAKKKSLNLSEIVDE